MSSTVPEERVLVKDKFTPDYFNSRSRVQYVDDENRVVFYFDYKKENDQERPQDTDTLINSNEVINWKVLQQLKRENKWAVIRHPMVLNYVNEKLIDCANIYTVQIILFGLFLFLLSAHIFSKNLFLDLVISVFLLIFTILMLSKATMKNQIPENRISRWFTIAISFNFVTYLATAAYIWLPTLFSYDNYHQEVKAIVLWLLPIIAIISAWMNFLYILRKSPYGIYIFMMVRILKSFGHIATIWIPTLIAFSFAFHLIMKDRGIEPWDSIADESNATTVQKLFVILQAVTKTSTMMIGEVDANDILGTKQWIPSFLVLAFEIITVILLMNLMVSLAVGDVSDLRNTAEDTLLKIKVNYVIETLQMSEFFACSSNALHLKRTNNILEIIEDGSYVTKLDENVNFGADNQPSSYIPITQSILGEANKAFDISFINAGMRVRLQPSRGRAQSLQFKNCFLQLLERFDSGIPLYSGDIHPTFDTDSVCRKYAQWLIGINWKAFVEI